MDHFVKLNWKIAGCGLPENLIKDLQNEYNDEHLFSTVDITNSRSVLNWSKIVLAKFGPPDILINNAGIINKKAKMWEISKLEFNNVITTNIIGTFNVTKAFLPAIIKSKKGIIINISSSWGRKGEAMFSAYCSSKFAIEGLTQSLAQELPNGLITVSLDPGNGINTDMLKKCYPEDAKNYPTAEQWAEKAVKFILKISEKDNGKALTIG